MTNYQYQSTEAEGRIYKMWQESGCFKSGQNEDGTVSDDNKIKATPYVVVIPPPNVTGRLHMGHALNNTLQDVVIRQARMQGRDALWVAGTDHAGIATQTVVKKMLDALGIDYRTLGREAFIDKVWEWKNKYGDMILNQLKSIGSSCDWNRTRFTMDEERSKGVMACFLDLYKQGLIYRGKRIVNWCPVDRTALADDEVETKEGGEKGFLWQIKYKVVGSQEELVVATTRPETLFGDVAVAVHPEDERYQKFIGQSVEVPLCGRRIPIIADSYVDKDFGTGCLKITPAHDPNDFEVGTRHGLIPLNVMNDDATMNDNVPASYQNLDRYKCREKVLVDLKEADLLVSEEERMTPVGRSYRSGAVIEYRLSDQWFVKMKPLAEKVLAKHSELNIQPARWNKTYLEWLNNIRDWCISRQIWWGHRIPAWFCPHSGYSAHPQAQASANNSCPPIVSEEKPSHCPHCQSNQLVQETDVLDTWFSSALWPMSTLGWPQKTKDFERYFPTTTLMTSKDIIFFWVARMNMMAVHFTGQLPYKNVFIHPVVLDEKGETMSKSKGNGIDPLVVIKGATLEDLLLPVNEARPSNLKEIVKRIEKNFPTGYEGVGADALRYTLLFMCSGGQQLKISLNSFQDIGRRFITKLTNAGRFLFMHLENYKSVTQNQAHHELSCEMSFEDVWMQAQIHTATQKINAYLADFDFTHLGDTIYHLVWNNFCDWYLELVKVRLNSEDLAIKGNAVFHVAKLFEQILRLLHPMIPFVTEDLWQHLKLNMDQSHFKLFTDVQKLLMLQEYPQNQQLSAKEIEVTQQFDLFQRLITDIRSTRKIYKIKEGDKILVTLLPLSEKLSAVVSNMQSTIKRLAQLSDCVVIQDKKSKPSKVITAIDPDYEVYLHIAESVDPDQELARIAKERARSAGLIQQIQGRLSNEAFLKNADESVIAEQKKLLQEAQTAIEKLSLLESDVKAWR